MKKLFVFFALTFIVSNFAISQKETYNWYFGGRAGITFLPDGKQPMILNNGCINTREGCSTISDSLGNLLFCTDGITVYNKSLQIMPNGYELAGNSSSTQSSLVVPIPGNTNLFYIFTTAAVERPDSGMQYSIVDLSKDGGLGDVVIKNKSMFYNSTEKITAVKHFNNRDIWVICHEWSNDVFRVYIVTPAGLDTVPRIFHIGSQHDGANDRRLGYLKASPDGKKLALVQYDATVLDVLNFDNKTGNIYNSKIFDEPYLKGAYGVEFSSNSKKLYVSNFDSGLLLQYDIQDDSLNNIIQTGTFFQNLYLGSLQLAPDGKIYLATEGSKYLGIINDPDSTGDLCNFVLDGLYLENGISALGLPTFIQSYFRTASLKIIGDTLICQDGSTKLSTESDYFKYLWSTGDTTREITINKEGTYSLKVTNIDGSTESATINVKLYDIKITGLNDTDFGKVLSGSSSQLNFTIKNKSNSPIEIKNISVKNLSNIFKITTNPILPVSLDINSTIDGTLTFNPDSFKIYSDTLIIEVDKPCQAFFPVALKGTATAEIVVYMPDTTATIGTDNYCMPLYLIKDKNFKINEILKYKVEIKYNYSALKPENVSGLIESYDRIINFESDNLKLDKDFMILNSICGLVLLPETDKIPFRITDFELSNPLITVQKFNGSLTVNKVCVSPIRRIQSFTPMQMEIQPNPANQIADIKYQITDECNVKLALVNYLGQEIAILVNEFQQKGEHNYHLSIANYQLNDGIYFLKLIANEEISTGKVVIIR